MSDTPDAPVLLVPIQVWAMSLNGQPRTLRRWSMNYDNLQQFQSPEPDPFHTDTGDTYSAQPKNQGVYLHWNLPAALRHGVQEEGVVAFPPVPNRWLIVRLVGPPSGRTASAWVVESDQVNTDAGDGSAHASGSAYLDTTSSTPRKMQIGRNRPLTGWSEPGPSGISLNTVAPANLMFSAFQPTCNNVFSFHDNLVTQDIIEGTLSYLIVGWHANSGDDPLAKGGDLLSRLQELNWEVTGAGSTTRTLYHGMVNDVAWKQGSEPIPSEADTAQADVNIAVGNTAIDALTALVASQTTQQHSSVDALLLEAFYHGMLHILDQPGGRDLLEDRLREKWYGFTAGGTQWEIVDATPSETTTPTDPPTPDQIAAENAWLRPLNEAQAALDQCVAELRALQRELYEMWWKRGYANWYWSAHHAWPSGTSRQRFEEQLDPGNADSLVSQVNAKLGEVAERLSHVPSQTDATTLEQAADEYARERNLPTTRRLKANPLPRYWHANDPVVLVSGVNHAKVDDFQGTLPCRWPDQVVSAFTYDSTNGSTTITLDQIHQFIPKPDGWDRLPVAADVVEALVGEFFLADPANAAAIAGAVLHASDQQTVDDLADHMGTQLVAANPDARLPYFGLEPWEQAWVPLFLEWQVAWYPIPFQSQGDTLWTFDGLEYRFDQTIPQPPLHTIKGRSLLTPHAQNIFGKRLDDYLSQHPDEALLRNLDDFIAQTDHWDFLSQTLEGFTTQVALRDPGAGPVPQNTPKLFHDRGMADLIGDGHFHAPLSLDATADPWHPGDSTFEGLRAGQFLFEELSIVDRFGQLIEVITTDNAQSFSRLIVADEMQPTHPVLEVQSSRVVQLPPRLVQDGRLRFEFASANGDSPQSIAPGSGINPLVGWVLPNHLDQALSIYSPDGTYLGEMSLAVDGAGDRVVGWDPSPDGTHSLDQIAQENIQLGAFLGRLQQQGADAFFAFLEVIDETLWTVDPMGGRADQNLSVLVGRPLALARATLRYELLGPPLRDPRWPDTFKSDLENPLFLYREYEFPVRLGSQLDRQDGLIGYFLNGDYDRFNAVHQPEDLRTLPTAYIATIGDGNYVSLTFAQDNVATVTLLLDPRAGVHAYTALFPAARLDLPAQITADALKRMQATFHVGPLLGYLQTNIDGQTGDTTTSMQMPTPAEQGGEWSWYRPQGAQWLGLTKEDSTARLRDGPPSLREGMLTLKDAFARNGDEDQAP